MPHVADLTTAIAASVHEVLRARGIQQRQIAPVLGLSQPAVSDRLRGRTPFTLADLDRIAEHLGVPVARLLEPPALLVDDGSEVTP